MEKQASAEEKAEACFIVVHYFEILVIVTLLDSFRLQVALTND
jgi:hypothetical protein